MPLPRAQGGLRTAAVFCLCALFAILAMGLTLLASGAYRGTAADADLNYTHRTAMSYIINQVRRCDTAGGVTMEQFEGVDALALREDLDGATYVTLLYLYGGALRELYMEEGTDLSPEDGTAILPLYELTIDIEGDRVCISFTAEPSTEENPLPQVYTGMVALRAAGEGGRA